MNKLVCFVLLLVLGVTQPAVSAPAQAKPTKAVAIPYELKGIRLGMTLEQCKAVKPPDNFSEFRALDREGGPTLNAEYYIVGRSMPAPFTIGGVECHPFYSFVRCTDGAYRLYGIIASPDSSNFASLKKAFLERFGTPKADVSEKVQNRIGNTFENDTVTWDNGSSTIMLERFSDNVTESMIGFTHTKLSDLAQAAQKDRPASADF